jgi:hypothetical protein
MKRKINYIKYINVRENPQGQSRMDNLETQDEDKHKTICEGSRYAQTNTNNVSKTRALLQTTGGKDKPIQPSSNICICK